MRHPSLRDHERVPALDHRDLRPQEGQRRIELLEAIRRVRQDEVHLWWLPAGHAGLLDGGCITVEPHGGQVRARGTQGRRIGVNEQDGCRTAAQRFDPEGPASTEEVEDPQPCHAPHRAQHVEDRFLDPVRRRSDAGRQRRWEPAAT